MTGAIVDRTNDSGWIQTVSGRRFYPLSPRITDIDLGDIAHALANVCRFTGHCSDFYSVAQHSVLVAGELPPALKPWGLLHDASEAYLVDVPRPLKRRPEFTEYRAAEQATERVIAERFGLAWPMPPEVKNADLRILATEARDLMPHRERDAWSWMPEPYRWRVLPWSPAEARHQFLRQAALLGIA